MNNDQFEDYNPFFPGSHFPSYDTQNFRKISCPDCEQLVDPSMVQVHRRTDCFNKHELGTRYELCGRHMLLTNLGRHMETHQPSEESSLTIYTREHVAIKRTNVRYWNHESYNLSKFHSPSPSQSKAAKSSFQFWISEYLPIVSHALNCVVSIITVF